jgi:dTDP-4-amino-4,6-dideoxygalactose transaminase
MNVAQVEAAITQRTRAVIAVHMFGLALDLDPLARICRERALFLVEDCAQATGAAVDGRRVGSFGDVGCFSFHPSKTLAAAGDAGAMTTDNPDVAARARGLRYFGQRARKVHSERGHNSKLDALQAIVLFHKLPFLDTWNARRRERAQRLMCSLDGLPLAFQGGPQDERQVYHLLQVDCRGRRDPLLDHLRADNIDAVVRYPTPLHLQPAFRDLGYAAGDFPVAERLALDSLCLPLRPDLSEGEVGWITRSAKRYFGL